MSPMLRWSGVALVLGCGSSEPKEDPVDPGLDGVADTDTDTDADADTDADTDADADTDVTTEDTGGTGDTGPTAPQPLEWVDELAVTDWSYVLRVAGTDAGWVLATTAFTPGAELGDPASPLVLGQQDDAVWAELAPGAVLGSTGVVSPVLPENELIVTDVVTLDDGTARLLTTDMGAEPWTDADPSPGALSTSEAQLRLLSSTGATDLWSIRPLDLDSAVQGGDLAVHPSGALTVTAGFVGSGAVLPDGTVLDTADGAGVVARIGDDGVVDWFHQIPAGFPRVVADGDEVVLSFDVLGAVRLGTHSLPAPAVSGLAVARLDASGDALWLRGFDGMGYASEPLPVPAPVLSGSVAVPVWGALVPVGFATPPTLSGAQHLVVLDGSGEPVWTWSSADGSRGPESLVVDAHDTLWSFVQECDPAGTTFSPSLEPTWTSSPCTDTPQTVLLGHDAASGVLRYARALPVAPFTGPYGTIGSPFVLAVDDVAMSDDGQVAAVARFGRDLRAKVLLLE